MPEAERVMSAPIYTITLRAERDDGVRGLRALLKRAWRDHRMRAVEVQQRPAVARRRRRGVTQERRQTRGKLMDMSKYAGAAFLGLDDVVDAPIRAEIAAVELGNYDKPVLTFSNGFRFSLNVTNTQTLIKAWGSESDDWVGERLELYAGETKYQGEAKPSVLARPLAREAGEKKKPTAAAPAKAQQRGSLDDEIPF
jgi:hypothetical protein